MANVMRGKCTLPYFQVADCDAAVWNFTRKLLEDPSAMMATLRAAQEEMRNQQSTLYARIAELDQLITEHTREFDGLVRDYRQIRRDKEKAGTLKQSDMLLATLQHQADEITETIQGLTAQKERLAAQLDQRTISDAEIMALEEFAGEIQPKLPYATFHALPIKLGVIKPGLRPPVPCAPATHALCVGARPNGSEAIIGKLMTLAVEWCGLCRQNRKHERRQSLARRPAVCRVEAMSLA
ncbi:MAG: hypothetical protein M3R61_08205 [Chloroflexota bacterium]|nr:hypothetical protein [Chloroflexota bacterium]